MNIMGNDKVYVYGSSNGAEYDEVSNFDDGHGLCGKEITKRTHWDPRIEVMPFPEGSQVQIGVVPPTPFNSGDPRDRDVDSIEFEPGRAVEWVSDNGQFLTLDRSGLNRLIEALQEAGAATFGRDRW